MRRSFGRIGAAVTVYQVAMAVRQHWVSIPSVRRERLTELVRRSGLRPSGLSRAEQTELRELLGGLGLPLLGRRLAAIAFAKRRGRGR